MSCRIILKQGQLCAAGRLKSRKPSSEPSMEQPGTFSPDFQLSGIFGTRLFFLTKRRELGVIKPTEQRDVGQYGVTVSLRIPNLDQIHTPPLKQGSSVQSVQMEPFLHYTQ